MADSPITIQVNSVRREVPAGTTLAGLLQSLELNPRYLAVERNLHVVPRTQHPACVLQPGDELEIVTLVGGG